MKKYCINCGFENASENRFCRNCGKELPDIKPQEKFKKEEIIQKKPEPKKQEPTAKVIEPKEEPSLQETSKYRTSDIPPEKIKPIYTRAAPKDMSKKILMIATIAIILSIVSIVLAIVIQPTLEIEEETIGTNELKNNAITGNKVLDGTLTDADIINSGISKIAANSITGDMILSDAITIAHLSNDVIESISGQVNITNNSITSEKIVNGEIKTIDLEDDSITTAKIKDGEVRTDDIADNAIDENKIATDAVGYSEIASNSVRADELASNSVGTIELVDDAVTYDKMEIKIKCKTEDNVYYGVTINHGLGFIPTSIVLTPQYNSTLEGGLAVLHANTYDVNSNSFKIALWKETELIAGSLQKVLSSEPQKVSWIAIYSPA